MRIELKEVITGWRRGTDLSQYSHTGTSRTIRFLLSNATCE
jgi:hypothetical protein